MSPPTSRAGREVVGPVTGEVHLQSAVAAHTGLVREKQEDAHLVLEGIGFAAVADGMGGHNAGEVASGLAIEALREHFGRVTTGTQPRGITGFLRRLGGAGQPGAALAEAIRLANRRILASARRNVRHRGMGTTLVTLWLCGERVHFAHVGDSRIYHWRAGTLRQLTEDHSLLNEYLRLGVISATEAAGFPHKNVIVRAVGLSAGLDVDVGQLIVQPEDRFLLCSDGLTDLVDDATICASLADGDAPELAAQRLVSHALDAGGIDNVTALVIHVRPNQIPPDAPEVKDDAAPAVADSVDSSPAPDGHGG